MYQQQSVCSFCGTSLKQATLLITGPKVYICDNCVVVCLEIVVEKGKEDDALKCLFEGLSASEVLKDLDPDASAYDLLGRLVSVAKIKKLTHDFCALKAKINLNPPPQEKGDLKRELAEIEAKLRELQA